jgi:hypothetical protein
VLDNSVVVQWIWQVWQALAVGVVLLLPGAAWLAWFPLAGRDFAQQLAAMLGISLSLTCLAALFTFLSGVQLSGWALAGLYILAALAALSGWIVHRVKLRLSLGFFLTVLIGGVIVAWRLYQARVLVLPPWVDSLHHVLIVRVMLEQGGLRGDLLPYLPVPFYYHFGFHSIAAAAASLAGFSADRAVLVIGQMLNAAVCAAVYRLGWTIWRDNRRALVAVLLVAFFSTMPAYYLTWGRYTLLSGLILLALAVAEVLDWIRTDRQAALSARQSWSFALRLGLFTAGALLSHYLAGLILALFLVVCGLYLAWRDLHPVLWRAPPRCMGLRPAAPPAARQAEPAQAGEVLPAPAQMARRVVLWSGWLPLLGSVLAGALLALPWVWRTLVYSVGSISLEVTLPVELGGSGISTSYATYLWALLGPQRNHWLLLLGALGLLLMLIRPSKGTDVVERLFWVWSLLVVLGCLPLGINLAPFQPHHMVMVVFLPVVLASGHLLVAAGEAVSLVTRRAWPGWAAACLALALLTAWGARTTRNIINPVTLLADAADRQALEWVQANTPVEARFFINTTPWQGSVYRGVDGGWWILPLTGRQTLLPPVVYSWGEFDYVNQINDWASLANQIKSCSVEFWKLVADARLDYIYIHQQKGSLQPEGLAGCPRLKVVYQQQGVWIYRVNP